MDGNESRRGRMVGAKREKSDAIVILTDEPKYSEASKVIRSVTLLMDLGLDVHSIHVLVLVPRSNVTKSAKTPPPTNVWRKGIEVRALTLKL